MAVFRIEKNKNYTSMANYHFRDKNLSWKAKGILSNMLSLPDDWDYSLAGLATLSSDGTSATRTAIKELEEHGYLIRRPIRKDGRISDWEYLIFENPQTAKQAVENLLVENQQIENNTQLNTNKSSTNESSTKELKESKKAAPASFDSLIYDYVTGEGGESYRFKNADEIVNLLRDWLKVRKAKRAAMTDRAIELNLQKLDRLAKESKMSVADYLEEIIRRGWQAFYAIKTYGNDNKTYGRNGIAISNEPSDLDDVF